MKRNLFSQFFIGTLCLFWTFFCLASRDPSSSFRKDSLAQRIISLGPSITESLYLLGVQDRLVGVTLYCTRPAETALKEKVGNALTVNIEKIFTLKPDLILATSLTHPKNIEKLRNLGIRVEIFPAAESFNQLCDQFLQLAKWVGKLPEAEKEIAKARKQVLEIRHSANERLRPGLIIQTGAKPLLIAPKISFMNDFVEFAGGINLAPEGTLGHISREQVLNLNPEVILITTMGIAGQEEQSAWEKFPQITAVKDRRIHIIDSDKFCSPTPLSFVKTLQEIKGLLHPSHE